jgi:hypothetical protein
LDRHVREPDPVEEIKRSDKSRSAHPDRIGTSATIFDRPAAIRPGIECLDPGNIRPVPQAPTGRSADSRRPWGDLGDPRRFRRTPNVFGSRNTSRRSQRDEI